MRPAQHYTMGGVRTDHTGESPTLKGLFAAGEAACWDMHGFNRLGGNSVAETVVAGMIVGEFIADFCDRSENDVQHSDRPRPRVPASASRPSSTPCSHGSGAEDANALRVRDAGDHDRRRSASSARGEDLEPAVDELQKLLVSAAATSACATGRAAPIPSSSTAYRVQKMLKLALCVAYGALRAPRAAARISARTIRAATTPNG